MDKAELERRAEISRRLKAARWLVGSVDMNHKTSKGRPKPMPQPLTREKLAERQLLVDNGITANMLGEIERLDRPVFPMEITVIADALEIPASFFLNPELSWPQEDVGPRGGALRHELRGGQPSPEDRPGEGETRGEGRQSNGDA